MYVKFIDLGQIKGESEMKIYIEHYRIPDVYVNLFYEKSGPPDNILLERYSRGFGWKDKPHTWKFMSPCTKGGMTIARTEINGEIYIGKAFCSMSDVFCYKTGRELAVQRLMNEVGQFSAELEMDL
jgi:hypothetical protein